MDHDSTIIPVSRKRDGSPAGPAAQDLAAADVDPATTTAEDEDEARLPEAIEETAETVAEGPLAVGHAAIENAVRLAPTSPGVYRMLNAGNDVLYVGKAKNVASGCRPMPGQRAAAGAHPAHDRSHGISRDHLDHDRNRGAAARGQLIKQLRPRFNVQLRDDKSFPYIPDIRRPLGAADPQASWRAIAAGRYFGPFASAGAVGRTITALQRAFLIRSCTDGFFESRTGPACSIKSAAAPAPAPARSISPAIPSWCARPTTSCPAAAIW